jgi:cell wall assembly regulator SMI1
MKKSLEILFEKSIVLGDVEYSDTQIKSRWVGNPPATVEEIENTEKRLGLKLPQDYIELVTIANGFPTCSNSVEPSFQKVEEIDFYKNYQWNVIDTWKEMGELKDVVRELEKAIIVAGFEEEQQFLIIPPSDGQQKWKYWKFAMWIPGEEEYKDLKSYFESVIEFLNGQILENEK